MGKCYGEVQTVLRSRLAVSLRVLENASELLENLEDLFPLSARQIYDELTIYKSELTIYKSELTIYKSINVVTCELNSKYNVQWNT